MTFIDTSAFFALADRADTRHQRAVEIFAALLRSDEALVTHNYILAETAALMARRLHRNAAVKFLRESEKLHVIWVDRSLHTAGTNRFAEHRRQNVSFVDCVSFSVMEALEIPRAFAFDDDFQHEGFLPVA